MDEDQQVADVSDQGSAAVAGTPQRPRKKARWAVGAVAAAALAVGGGAYAVQRTGLLGAGGATPDTVVPKGAVAYLRLDTNPDAGQKIAAFRLFSKLPEVRDVAGDDKDWRKSLFDKAKADSSCLKDKDFDRDVKPWLGDRAAVATYLPGEGKSLVPMVAVAVTDQAKAKAGLPALLCGANGTDVRWLDGFGILTEKGQGDAIVGAIKAGTLHDNPDFQHDMEDLGSDGIASAWVDAPSLARADLSSVRDEATRTGVPGGAVAADEVQGLKDQLRSAGRISAALRLDADAVEVAGIQRGAATPVGGTGDKVDLGTLPSDTVGAVGVAGLDRAVTQQWPALMKQMDQVAASSGSKQSAQQLVDQVQSSLGITLPDDLATLLGRQTVLAVAAQDFSAVSSTNLPKAGLRTTTDAKKAESITNTLLDRYAEQQGISSAFLPVHTGVSGQTFTLAMDDDYRARLAQAGSLNDDDGFTKAVDDGKGTLAAYVSLDAIEKYYLDKVPADHREFVKAMRGIGLVSDQDDQGRGHFSLRVVAD